MRSETEKNSARAVLRKEVSFYASDEALEKVFEVMGAEGVSIIADTITNKNVLNDVRMIVGPQDFNSPHANMVVSDALRSEGVRYRRKEVIQIVNPYPGISTRIAEALYNIKLFATYSGINSTILDISDNETALKALKENDVVR